MTSIQDIYNEYEEFAYVGQKFITCDDFTIELIGEISIEKFYKNKDFDLITTCGDKIFKCVFDDMEGFCNFDIYKECLKIWDENGVCITWYFYNQLKEDLSRQDAAFSQLKNAASDADENCN